MCKERDKARDDGALASDDGAFSSATYKQTMELLRDQHTLDDWPWANFVSIFTSIKTNQMLRSPDYLKHSSLDQGLGHMQVRRDMPQYKKFFGSLLCRSY
mmetsp:Transcript_11258/g.19949  ORF Transcript_11258/g.19949 Transcript_11258/m.19949 type:complete len:100 (-) Transcript_11258:903-1202(-)